MKPITGYDIAPVTRKEDIARLFKIVRPRRGATGSVPGLLPYEEYRIADAMFHQFGLDDLAGCVTAEQAHRPVPQVFRASELQHVLDVFNKWYPHLMERLAPTVAPATQTYHTDSALGWPFFTGGDEKKILLMRELKRIQDEGISGYEKAFVTQNVRLQAEVKTKVRDYQYLSDDASFVFEKEVTQQDREIEVDGPSGPIKRVASRVRLVFNHCVLNLYKQIFDTAWHKAILKYASFKHNMYSEEQSLRVVGKLMCFDVKHMERITAIVALPRARFIGGKYQQIVELMQQLPYVCPTYDRKGFAFLAPQRDLGFLEQYASGDSAVAGLQKELFCCLYAEFFSSVLKYEQDMALTLAMNGGNDRLRIFNYGDDNAVSGDPATCQQLFDFMALYLPVAVEDPPKFLGFQWIDSKWRLPVSSYISKTYLNERSPGSFFRPFPFLGWVLKRATYEQLGDPRIFHEVFPFENQLLKDAGLPWSDIITIAEEERIKAASRPLFSNSNYLLEKAYLLTADELLLLDPEHHFGIPAADTVPYVRKLVGTDLLSRMTKYA